MKTFHKILIVALSTTALSLGRNVVNAEEQVIPSVDSAEFSSEEVAETYPLVIDDLNSETLNFESEEARSFYEENVLNKPDEGDFSIASVTAFPGLTSKRTAVSSQTYRDKFLGYNSLTPNWAMASSYTLASGKSMTFGSSYNYKGTSVSLSVSHSTDVSTSFKANSKKASRLAAKGDVKVTKYKYTYYKYGNLFRTDYVYRAANPKIFTHYVKYK